MTCPLCLHKDSTFFHKDQFRSYYRCPNCSLVFVPAEYHLPPEDEKKRYDTHENDPTDHEYRAFLNRLLEPLKSHLTKGERGLDFGSGPGPTLSLMLSEVGYPTENYDPFYANDKKLLNATYDFLTCTETIEHLSNPKKEWELFLTLVKKNGWIGVMTEMRNDENNFAEWYYKKDPTHIRFYNKKTFEWLAKRYGLIVEFVQGSVILFQI